MSESNPPNGLTDAERQRLRERAQARIDEAYRLIRMAQDDLNRLAADDAFRRQQPGEVIEFPRGDDEPGDGDPEPPSRHWGPPSGWTEDKYAPDSPTDQGTL